MIHGFLSLSFSYHKNENSPSVCHHLFEYVFFTLIKMVTPIQGVSYETIMFFSITDWNGLLKFSLQCFLTVDSEFPTKLISPPIRLTFVESSLSLLYVLPFFFPLCRFFVHQISPTSGPFRVLPLLVSILPSVTSLILVSLYKVIPQICNRTSVALWWLSKLRSFIILRLRKLFYWV